MSGGRMWGVAQEWQHPAQLEGRALAYQAWDNHQGVESSHASPSLGWALLCDPPKVSAPL